MTSKLTRFGVCGALLAYLLTHSDEEESTFSFLSSFMGAEAAAECCGIVGYIGSRPIAGEVCI